MDLLCCHSGGRGKTANVVRRQRRQSEEKREKKEQKEDLNVTLRILKADLPQNGNLFGAANLYTDVKWEGDTSLCDWQVASTPTLWLDAVAPEWDHAFPPQPQRAFVKGCGASVVFEVWQDSYFFGTNSMIGEAVVPAANLLEGIRTGDSAERDFMLWLDDEDAGTLTVQVLVEPSPAREALSPALRVQRAVRLQRALLAQTGSPRAGPRDEHEEEQSSSARSCGQSFSPRSPRRPRANTLIDLRASRRAPWSSSSSSGSSRSEAEDDTPAQRVANAMQSRWNASAKKDLRKSRTGPLDNKPWQVDRSPGDTDDPALQALKILESVKARGPDKVTATKAVGHQKPFMPSRDEASTVKALMKKLRVTARKFPRNGLGLLALSKERFFAITQEGHSKVPGRKGSTISGALYLSWFEDQASWQRHARPLGYISLASICGRSVDQQSAGFVVTIKFLEDEEDGPDAEPECLSVIFGSLLAAEEWNSDLDELLELTCRQ